MRALLGVLATAFLAVAGIVAFALPASAHVTVHPSSVVAGSGDVQVGFLVPNERDDASTVKLQVFFPANLPLLSLDVLPLPGWTDRVVTAALRHPIRTDDGLVTEVVREVTWTAARGTPGIGPGQYEDFLIAIGAVPREPGPVVFKALQTYSSGEIVRWIEVPVKGEPAPDTPAPVLQITRPATGASSRTAPSGPSGVASGGTGSGLAIAALAVAVLALLLGAAALLTTRRRRPGAS